MQDCFADKLSNIERCVSEIKALVTCNMLKLNDGKTEFIVLNISKTCAEQKFRFVVQVRLALKFATPSLTQEEVIRCHILMCSSIVILV